MILWHPRNSLENVDGLLFQLFSIESQIFQAIFNHFLLKYFGSFIGFETNVNDGIDLNDTSNEVRDCFISTRAFNLYFNFNWLIYFDFSWIFNQTVVVSMKRFFLADFPNLLIENDRIVDFITFLVNAGLESNQN